MIPTPPAIVIPADADLYLWLADEQARRFESVYEPDIDDLSDAALWDACTVPAVRDLIHAARLVIRGRGHQNAMDALADAVDAFEGFCPDLD